MAIQEQRKQIGESTYVVRGFGGKRGRSVTHLLIKMFGPTLANILGQLGGGKGLSIADLDVTKALETFATTSTEKDFTDLCDAFAEVTKVVQVTQGNVPGEILLPLNFDSQFSGCDPNLLAWLAFAIEVNCAGFFAGSLIPVRKVSG